MPPLLFEPTISEGEQPQTYALDRAANGTGYSVCMYVYKFPYIYHHKHGSADAATCCRLIALNNNI
jgi:hypothetical protein